ncbi:ricin-type beta-trefoil lectin domain protein [Actinoplanes sp. NPDC024001]|uniref:ricin-type beta-trefoil lectin domain protein n=1 Tax=Actinoplanes sp. NPDC024001 TaxID=3154598 RepID=UPI0033CF79DB
MAKPVSAGSAGDDAVVEGDGDDRDPLLVRPFVLQEGGHSEAPASAATWPADPAREIPTQVIPAVPATPAPSVRRTLRRRSVLLAATGVAAVLAVVGWAVLRPALTPTVSTSLADQQFPVISGPAPAASVTPSDTSPAAAAGDADNSGGETADGVATEPRAESTSRPAVITTSKAPQKTTSPSVAAGTTAPPAPPADLVPSAQTDAAALVSGNGLCLDLRGGDIDEGSDVHVDDCNGTSPQRWQLNSDRTLKVGDLCAYMEGTGEVELARCDGRNTAQWAMNNDGRLMNAANGRCLTDPHFGARPANEVVVAPCAGTSNQRWTFR